MTSGKAAAALEKCSLGEAKERRDLVERFAPRGIQLVTGLGVPESVKSDYQGTGSKESVPELIPKNRFLGRQSHPFSVAQQN